MKISDKIICGSLYIAGLSCLFTAISGSMLRDILVFTCGIIGLIANVVGLIILFGDNNE